MSRITTEVESINNTMGCDHKQVGCWKLAIARRRVGWLSAHISEAVVFIRGRRDALARIRTQRIKW